MIYKKALLLLLFVGTALAISPIIITAGETGRHTYYSNCAYGPSYGCRNISTAHDCDMLKYCISDVWSKWNLPEDNSNICELCKEMIKEARDQLLSNETREEIKEVFEGSCNLIPIKAIAEECCKIADNFIPELVETLASEMNPQIICATAGLCNSKWVQRMIDTHKVMKPRSDCEVCHGFASDLHRYVKDSPKSIILEHALKACGYLNSFSTSCKVTVINHFDELYNFFYTRMNDVDDTCTFFGLCHQIFPHRKIKDDDTTCEFCETIVQHWVDVMTAGTTEEEFEQILYALCNRTGSYKDECDVIVKDYFREVYNFLVHELKPKEVCEAVGLCDEPNSFYKENVWALLPPGAEEKVKHILEEEVIGRDEENALHSEILDQVQTNIIQSDIIGQDEANSYQPNAIPAVSIEPAQYSPLTPPLKKQKNVEVTHHDKIEIHHVPLTRHDIKPVHILKAESMQLPYERHFLGLDEYDPHKVTCVMCEYVLHDIQNFLNKGATEDEIKEAVGKVCNIMPKTVADECHEFVQTYGDFVINLLIQEIDPSRVCTLLKICPNKIELTKPDMRCDLCEFVINELDRYLEDEGTEEEIRNTLKEVCGYLPETVLDECKDFIDEYEEMIVEAILAAMNPEEVCAYLRMCQASLMHDTVEHDSPTMDEWKKSQVEEVQVEEVKKAGSPQCVMCEFAMSELASVLKDKKTDEEIKEAVESLCGYLPKSVAGECKAFVETYGEAIIQLLIDETKDPEEVCSELGLCASVSVEETTIKSLKLDKCDSCTMVVSYLDKMLVDDRVEEKIDNYMEKICKVVPPSYTKQCKKIIHVYGPYFLGLLGEFGDPHKVCAAVSLCTKHPEHANLLGGEKCTWGPSYWCISPFHAKSCHATEHCKAKVWKKT